MESKAINTELQHQLRMAAYMGINTSNVFPNISHLLGYRQRVAQEILGEIVETEKSKMLLMTFENINNEIKSILGL